jgi:hypothetical protein
MAVENFQAPGIVVRELRAGVPQVRGVPTSIGAFVITSLRGPVAKATRVDSFAKAQRIFGNYDPNSYWAESTDAFFKNGGSGLYLVRIQPSGGGGSNVLATVTIDDAGAVNAATFDSIGPGSDYNSIKILVSSEDTRIGLTAAAIATTIPAAPISEVDLTAATAALVTVGDTLNIVDSVTPANNLRFVVAQKVGNKVLLEDTQTIAFSITTALAYCDLETWTVSDLDEGRTVQGPYAGLRSSPLSQKNYFVNRLNTGDDELVTTVTDLASPVGATGLDNRPVNADVGGDLLTLGELKTVYADLDYIGNSSTVDGLYALDTKNDVRLIAIPGVTGTTQGAVSVGLIDYCSARADCVGIMTTPSGTSVANAVIHKSQFLGSSSYGIIVYPWVEILLPLTSQKGLMPPEGYVMGMVARTDRDRNVAKAPAGELVGRLLGTLGVETDLTDDERAQLYPVNIDPLQDIEGVGVSVMGSRTMESGEFNQINVRRTFIYLRESIREGTRFVLFEPNDAPTRAKARRVVGSFLKTEWERGNLEGDTIDEAFFVTCDKSNNPENIINEGKMFISIGVNIPRTTEFLVIEIEQDQRGLEAALA